MRKKPIITKNCLCCGKEYRVRNYRKNSSRFCSHSCWSKSRKFSPSSRLKISQSHLNEKNGMWKGDNVKEKALHLWIRRRLPQPLYCERCNIINNNLDLANISGLYVRRLDDWEYICRRCHMMSDGRMLNLKQFKKEENNG